MIDRRAVIPILVLLALLVIGTGASLVTDTASLRTPPAAQPTVTPIPATPASPATPPAIAAAVARVQHAFNAGDTGALCRPGALVDAAVIRRQDRRPGGCEAEFEALLADSSPMQLTVRNVSMRSDLATAVVTTHPGTTVSVDLVRGPRGWLISFSDGEDPMPALAGNT